MGIHIENKKAKVVAQLINKKGGKITFSKDDFFKLRSDIDPNNFPKLDDINIEPVKIDLNYAYKFIQDKLYVSMHVATFNKLVSWFPFIERLFQELESYIPRINKFLEEFHNYPKTGQKNEELRDKFLYTIKNNDIIEYELICLHFNFLLESEQII